MKKMMMSCGFHGQIAQVYDSYCDGCRELENLSVGVCLLSASQPTNLFTFAFGSSCVSFGVNVDLCSLTEAPHCVLYKVI